MNALAPTRIEHAPLAMAAGSTQTLANSWGGADRNRGDFLDVVLGALLAAQVTWMGTRDPVALRRELIALLAALG